MGDLHKRWEKINHRLRILDCEDQKEEAELFSEVYGILIAAYLEARELNDEMELLIRDTLRS